ncbi:pentapeptide repeat-containing protein [Argonema galeatum]|uniref:pentapeptide repeat-containing protein n=1 Tax=Argonema galeatum TaxID=2942762 RepID=UPI0020118C99|nr:pentapeptide repeat-containing protein [Argonema galeatum]MCL1468115.1 pentapeptide repeat-containing protein [Argonema galeatum A003/A1]
MTCANGSDASKMLVCRKDSDAIALNKPMKPKLLASATLLTTFSLVNPADAANPEHIRQLLSTKQCQKCDLSNAGLVMGNLANANLSGADLSRANLSRANLTGADLSGANLTGASLFGANLSGANLTGANLNAVDMRDTVLAQANLVGASLTNANFLGAIGMPSYTGTAEDFYRWAMAEAERDNYSRAMELFSQALNIKPDYPEVYLGRGMVRYQQGDRTAALADTQHAAQLFTAQGNLEGYKLAQDVTKGIETAGKPRRSGGGSNFLNLLSGIATLGLQLFF